MKHTAIQRNIGFALVEIIIACSIISISMVGVIYAANKGISLSNLALQEVQASFLLEEGAESVKSIRDTSWTSVSNLTMDASYYLVYNTSTNTWALSATPSTIDGFFTRTIVVSNGYRNGSSDIASTGTLDADLKKVTVTVSWNASSRTMSKSLVFYVANIF